MSAAGKPGALELAGVRARALDAASALLAEGGLEALSLRAIAKAAGIGLASIYHYFDNKEALVHSLALAGFTTLRQEMVAARARTDVSPMRASAQAFFAFAGQKPQVLSLMFDERLLNRHEALRSAEQQIIATYRAAIEADDRVPPPHQENAAYALWALGRGMASIVASYPGRQPPADMLQKLFAGGAYLINHPA